MALFFNLIYLTGILILSPWLIYKAITTGKYRRGMFSKFLGRTGAPRSPLHAARTAWFHGVSVGEIHLLKQVVSAFRQRHPDWNCVISTTTDTGHEVACKRFPDLEVIY